MAAAPTKKLTIEEILEAIFFSGSSSTCGGPCHWVWDNGLGDYVPDSSFPNTCNTGCKCSKPTSSLRRLSELVGIAYVNKTTECVMEGTPGGTLEKRILAVIELVLQIRFWKRLALGLLALSGALFVALIYAWFFR